MSKTNDLDPAVAEMERALSPGKYIPYGQASDFIEGLEKVRKQLELLPPEPSGRVVRLFDIFLSGSYAKIDECDDSGGYLSMFFHSLFCGWIKARQGAGLSAEETIRQILNWMERDNYGFCHRIERELVQVLDSEGRRLLIAHFEGLVTAALPASMPGQVKAIFEYESNLRLPALTLKDIYFSTGSVASYAALCGRLGFSPLDCERLAELEMSRKHWHQALGWVEKGLALEPTRNWHNESSLSLAPLKPRILARVGRKEDAVAAAWLQFEASPSEMAYEELMGCVPKGEKAQWREKALAASAAKGDLGGFMNLCVKTKEWGRLSARIQLATNLELEAVSHYECGPAADGLARRDGLAAAKVYRALAVRILKSGKSKYYDTALKHLERARKLYLQAGGEAEWLATVRAIQTEHSRKKGILHALGLIETAKPASRPSFAERSHALWRKQAS